jgi:membrane protease YdiL (CAAX protease family)
VAAKKDGLVDSVASRQGSAGIARDASRIAQLPLPTILVVFAPLVLTTLMWRLMGPRTRPLIATYPMLAFGVYAAWNWLVILVGYLVVRRYRITWRDIGFTNFRLRDIWLSVAGALAGLLVVFPISTLIVKALGLPPMRGMNYSLHGPLDIIGAILATVLLGTLAEDILFRGFLLGLLRTKIRNLWVVGLIGVLMFTLIHIAYFGWAGMIFILLWSPLTVGLFLWRRSIYPSYGMHILNNLWAYVLMPLLLH